MIKVNSTIKINEGLIKRISQAQISALEKTTEALHTELEQAQVMPRDTGALQDEKTFNDFSQLNQGVARIIHEGPYARRLYFHPEYNFQKHENPFAMGEWYWPWLPGGIYEKFAINAYAKHYKKGAGI